MGASRKGSEGQHRMKTLNGDSHHFRLVGIVLALVVGSACAQEPITFYTSLHEQNLPVILAAFEKKSGIKVNAWRAGADKVLQRTVTEARAGRHDVDAVFVGSGELEALHREKLLARIESPSYRNLVAQAMPSHHEWAPAYLTVWVQEYNTNAIRKDALPKSWHDLRQPRWKGKLGIDGGDDDWWGKMVSVMGEAQGVELFRALVAANGVSVRKGHSLLGNLVVSGEVPFAIAMHSNLAISAKKKGAPVDWIALDPVIARANGIGVLGSAPHPKEARSFYEYLISDEGQQLLAERDYVPANRAIDSPLKHAKLRIIDPGPALDQGEKWAKLFDETFVRKRP
jgi:iron(III) transport system substrate-binding protein